MMHSTMNFFSGSQSYVTVFNQNLTKLYSKPVMVESDNNALQTIIDIKVNNLGYVYYVSYEEDFNRKIYGNIKTDRADISTNKYHLYSISAANNMKHFTFTENKEVYHGMGVLFTDDNLVKAYALYSPLSTLRKSDKNVSLEGLVEYTFKTNLNSDPQVKHEIFKNEELKNLLIESGLTPDGLLSV